MKERAQLPPKHTFSPLPGFFERKREIKAIERALSGVPTFNVLFGASSVGKTALCRQVLTQSQFHVLHYDLRIAGFADLSSLYFAFASQMEQYFVELSKRLEGYEDFEKESYAFKHDRMAIEKRVEGGGEVKTSDIAHILELFQSALLKYWSFEPTLPKSEESSAAEKATNDQQDTAKSLKQRAVDVAHHEYEELAGKPAIGMTREATPTPAPRVGQTETVQSQSEEGVKPKKLVPVIFFDEAHRLPLLIRDKKAMKCILDAMLVLTKQDRLIHVIHATSDPFYMHWLRQLNVMQHCKIMTIGDTSREEAEQYFREHLLPDVPEAIRGHLKFDDIFEVFGGKLAHISDYVADFVNADGKLQPKESSHYAQAHALLNLQLIHASPSLSSADADDVDGQASGFGIYSPLKPLASNDSPQAAASASNDFLPEDLLNVCRRLLKDDAIPYFPLCRELGARAVDGLIKGRILELRWVESVTPELNVEQSSVETGPLLLPTTPVVRSAMQQVVEEWKDYVEGQLSSSATSAKDEAPAKQ